MTQKNTLSRWWLLLGCWSIALAGLFSLVLVVARTPQLKNLPLFKKLFHEALVVHVDLSVLVWFLAIACLLWSLMVQGSKQIIPWLEEASILCMALGMAALTLSPLDPAGVAMMSNYIPVIHSPVFFFGLALIFCSVAFMLVRVFTSRQGPLFSAPQRYGLLVAALVTVVSLCAFFWSYTHMPDVIEGEQYYELVFWGGGHVLQFTHTQIVLLCWWLLIITLYSPFEGESKSTSTLGAPGDSVGGIAPCANPTPHGSASAFSLASPAPPQGESMIMYGLFSVALLVVFITPLAYVQYEVTSQEHRLFFTHLMIWLNGIAPAVFVLLLIRPLWDSRHERKGPHRALWSSLLMSVLLFVYGGVLALMIQGQNVVIPAHYHGSIVGITLAFMGVAYLLFPKLGYRTVACWKLAYWQPIVYGVGQIMHISGLAYSGGYGVLRKTPGGMENLEPVVKAALGFMGLGGLIAIIGGLMFVVVAYKAVRKTEHSSAGQL